VLGVNANRVGLVDLYFFNARGAAVSYFECVGGTARRLGQASAVDGSTTRFSTPWLCDRLTRYFAATVTLQDGTLARGVNSIRTMSCADRFALVVPPRVGLRQGATVRVIDRWQIGGIHTTLCVTDPGGTRRCRVIAFAPAVSVATVRIRPAARGDWQIALRVRRYTVDATLAVGIRSVPMKVPPTLLATGDSTMQGVDSFLADDLGRHATVISDVRPGYGISSVDWGGIAATQVSQLSPETTVISIGAAEGFPMQAADGATVTCCGQAWTDEYERRVRDIMIIYRRHGKGRVFYLTIVAPRDPRFVAVVNAVNQAIIRAGTGLVGVRVLRMDLLFSPHGFQATIRYGGRDVDVREPDGVHLNVSGTAIEARATATAIRASTPQR
jgi:hypothetical protein